MQRHEIINIIGNKHLTTNRESGEWSYSKGYKDAGKEIIPITSKTGYYDRVDLRFVEGNITVLVETKRNFDENIEEAKDQLAAYVEYEKNLTGNKVVAILASTDNDEIKVWRGVVNEASFLEDHTKLITMEEYKDLYTSKINDKEKVMENTYRLNELLHECGVNEDLRSQFVGTCLLALKNGLDSEYDSKIHTTGTLINKIKEVLSKLLEGDLNKAEKLSLLDIKVLGAQDIRELDIAGFRKIMRAVHKDILPFINDKSTAGQDLLNLFFTIFNKYVGKADKNQAFTPDHITNFMTQVVRVSRNSIVLDPCAGSGAFLVRAMTAALDDCASAKEQERVTKEQIFGFEFEDKAFGLVTTNMLIHGDGNSNIKQGSCFDMTTEIQRYKPNVILMNPPFNAQKKHMPKSYTNTWGGSKQDPSKGLYFAKYVMDTLNEIQHEATLAVILPVACAIGSTGTIDNMKKEILKENTLDAVFTLPNEVFYPGASASACCMVFKVGTRHKNSRDAFFGYYKEDGFKKKKNLGRVEQIDSETGESIWETILAKWLDLYKNRREKPGISAVQKVTGSDEWLCEAYMETDYSTLTETDFQTTLNDYLSYLVKEGHIYES